MSALTPTLRVTPLPPGGRGAGGEGRRPNPAGRERTQAVDLTVRIIGIDFGERRIGVAAADDRTRLAIPLTTLTVEGDPVETIVRLTEEERADELVVGLPLSLSGAEGPQAQRVREVVDAVSRRLTIPVRMWDERLTTAQARRQPAAAGRGSRGRRAAESRSRKLTLDAVAAAILLQAYMDSLRL